MLRRFTVKLLWSGVLVGLLLVWFTEASWTDAVMAAVGLALVSYIFGDQLILRFSTNVFATLAEAGLTFLYLALIGWYFNWSLSVGELLFICLFVAAADFVLHLFMKKESLDVM